jgi:hypothetical protein
MPAVNADPHFVSPASHATSAEVVARDDELDTMAARIWLGASPGKLILLTLGVAAMVFIISFCFDVLLVREGESRRAVFALSDVLASVLVGALFFLYGQARRQELGRRLETIALMNHHIRNALQVISASTHIPERAREVGAIEDAVNRIQWALREILPKI